MRSNFNDVELDYLRNVGTYADKHFISNDDMKALLEVYRTTKSRKHLDRIIRQVIKLVAHSAKKFRTASIEVHDLIHEGLISVIEAAEFGYSLDLPIKFTTYIKTIVDRRMRDYIESVNQSMRLPKHVISRQSKIKSGEEVNGTIYTKVSFDDPFEVTKYQIHEYINEEINPEYRIDKESLQFEIFRIFNELLTPIEIEVLVKYFGLGDFEEMKIKVIGEYMGITSQGIGFIRDRALTKLKNNSRCLEILRDYL